MAFNRRRKARLPPMLKDTTERRNKDGLTWTEQEKVVAAQLTGTLAPEALEREIEARYGSSCSSPRSSPAGDRRSDIFEEAYAATPPSQRARFVEIARKTTNLIWETVRLPALSTVQSGFADFFSKSSSQSFILPVAYDCLAISASSLRSLILLLPACSHSLDLRSPSRPTSLS